jgi:hypothetical protein
VFQFPDDPASSPNPTPNPIFADGGAGVLDPLPFGPDAPVSVIPDISGMTVGTAAFPRRNPWDPAPDPNTGAGPGGLIVHEEGSPAAVIAYGTAVQTSTFGGDPAARFIEAASNASNPPLLFGKAGGAQLPG